MIPDSGLLPEPRGSREVLLDLAQLAKGHREALQGLAVMIAGRRSWLAMSDEDDSLLRDLEAICRERLRLGPNPGTS